MAVEQGCNGLGDEAAGAQGGQRASGVCVCVPEGCLGEAVPGGCWCQQPGWWLALPAGKGWRWGWV